MVLACMYILSMHLIVITHADDSRGVDNVFVVSVCLGVCLDVCSRHNSRNIEPIKFKLYTVVGLGKFWKCV